MSQSLKPATTAAGASETRSRSFKSFYWFTILIWVGAGIAG